MLLQGSLPGGCPPGLSDDDLPISPILGLTPYHIKVPPGANGGDEIEIRLPSGEDRIVRVPVTHKAGDVFLVKIPFEHDKVIASTLHSIPGMDIVRMKPVIYASAFQSSHGSVSDLNLIGQMTERLLKQAQTGLLEKAAAEGCNAVLGLTHNVTTDSTGDHGNYKVVVVTAFGTPCFVLPAGTRTDPPTIAVAHPIPLH